MLTAVAWNTVPHRNIPKCLLSIPIELREFFEISIDNDSFADIRGEVQEVLDLRGGEQFANTSVKGTGNSPAERSDEGSRKTQAKDLVLGFVNKVTQRHCSHLRAPWPPSYSSLCPDT